MRDVDQLLRPLADRLAVELGHAKLGNDVLDVVARRDHPRARLEGRHDPAQLVPLRRRRQRDDRYPALRARRAVDKVELPADAAVKVRADAVGADLTRQVDLDRRVQGHLAIILGDHKGVVDVLGPVQLDDRVVVDKPIEPLGANDEPGDDLARVECLAAVGDDPGLDQVDDAVRKELGVNAQIAFVVQKAEHRIRDGPDPHLHGGAVGDQVGDMARDLGRQLALALARHLGLCQGIVDRDDVVDAADVDKSVAEGARHLLVDLGDDDAGRLGRGLRQADLDPIAAKAVLVRW